MTLFRVACASCGGVAYSVKRSTQATCGDCREMARLKIKSDARARRDIWQRYKATFGARASHWRALDASRERNENGPKGQNGVPATIDVARPGETHARDEAVSDGGA